MLGLRQFLGWNRLAFGDAKILVEQTLVALLDVNAAAGFASAEVALGNLASSGMFAGVRLGRLPLANSNNEEMVGVVRDPTTPCPMRLAT